MNEKKHIWMECLNEMRHDAIEKQKQMEPSEKSIELIGRMIYYLKSFAEAVRTYGLLAVEEEASQLDLENVTEAILYEAAELVTDGNSPEFMAEVLSNYYWVSQPEGYAATAAYIAIRGILLVQEGMHPYGIMQIAGSMLPLGIREKCMEVCRNYEAQKQEKKDETAKVYFETEFSRSENMEVREALDWLEREIIHMEDREIQRLLREVDNNYLVQALVGMKKNTRLAIARNMSTRLRKMIMEDCYQCADIDDCAIAEGAVWITEKLKVLQACGEIMDAESRMLLG